MKGKKWYAFKRLVEEAIDGYGETIELTNGVPLVMQERIKKGRQENELKSRVLAIERTRWMEWRLVPTHLDDYRLNLEQQLERRRVQQMDVKRLYALEREILEEYRHENALSEYGLEAHRQFILERDTFAAFRDECIAAQDIAFA